MDDHFGNGFLLFIAQEERIMMKVKVAIPKISKNSGCNDIKFLVVDLGRIELPSSGCKPEALPLSYKPVTNHAYILYFTF